MAFFVNINYYYNRYISKKQLNSRSLMGEIIETQFLGNIILIIVPQKSLLQLRMLIVHYLLQLNLCKTLKALSF